MGLLSKFTWCFCCAIDLSSAPLPQETKVEQGNKPIQVGDAKDSSTKVRIVVVSDTHLHHDDLKLPDGDILLHCGDILKWHSGIDELKKFNEWLGTLNFKHKIVIGGNHDTCISSMPQEQVAKLLTNAEYLLDRTVVVEGIRIYGAPWLPDRGCCYRANGFQTPVELLQEKWDMIPDDTDIVMTHGPPYGIRDTEPAGNVGSYDLLARVFTVKPKLHCFGHSHHNNGLSTARPAPSKLDNGQPDQAYAHKYVSAGKEFTADTLFVNAASTITTGNMRPPKVFDYFV